jgi:CubicO group peptidase (beta-lactamase class C family)
MGKTLFISLILLFGFLPRAELRSQNPNCPRFDEIAAVARLQHDLLDRFKLSKASLWLGTTTRSLLERSFGSNKADTVYSLFSSTKLITASTLMVLVDKGFLGLDDPVDKYLPYFKTKVGKATIRQLLTHSSGLPDSYWSLYVQSTTLDRSVREIAKLKALYKPGTAFLYGSVSYHVAARIAEVVTKKSWKLLVRQYLLDPLGMRHTDFLAFGPTNNPIVAIAGRSHSRDYARLLRMFLGRGVFGFRRVLSAKLVEEMLKVQNKGMKILKLPFKGLGPYGIGFWLDRLSKSGKTLQANHYGAFGFSPWLDLERGLCGVFAVTKSLFDVFPVVEAFRAKVDLGFLPAGVQCFGKPSSWCQGTAQYLVSQRPFSVAPGFSLKINGLPPRSPGWVFIGFKKNESGIDLLGTQFFLQGPIPFFLPGFSDGRGIFQLPLSWKIPLPGIQFYSQALWLNPKICTKARFSATAALRVRIL